MPVPGASASPRKRDSPADKPLPAMKSKTTVCQPPESNKISFRLDPDFLEELYRRASQQGMSIHELSRFYVVQALSQDGEDQALRHAHGEILENLRTFHSDFAFAVQEILRCAGNVSTEDARKWVEAIKPE